MVPNFSFKSSKVSKLLREFTVQYNYLNLMSNNVVTHNFIRDLKIPKVILILSNIVHIVDARIVVFSTQTVK